MVADKVCIVRNLVRVADGRVKPGHDGVEERGYDDACQTSVAVARGQKDCHKVGHDQDTRRDLER